MRTFLTAAALAVMSFAGAPSVMAGDFQASPVRVFLEDGAKSGMLTLTNRGDRPVRLQLSGFRWDEGKTGEPSLTPTDSLVLFPSLLELNPGQMRRVRVGVNTKDGAREETYRVIVEELPDHGAPKKNGIAIRMRMSIPIFVDPRGTVARGEVESARVEVKGERQLIFTLKNLGDQHFKAGDISLSLEIKGRREPLVTKLSGWYVLAGGVREHTVALPSDARCVTRATIDVQTDFAGRLERELAVSDPACKR
jgi:fimbrial chaperone protein